MSNEFGANVSRSLVERRVKTENCVSTFAVVRVVNTEIFISSIIFPFRNKQVNFTNPTFCFLGIFFWAPILVNRYEIRSVYGPGRGRTTERTRAMARARVLERTRARARARKKIGQGYGQGNG